MANRRGEARKSERAVPQSESNKRVLCSNVRKNGKKVLFMAKPIEPTPTLKGEDAKRLLYELANPPNVAERSEMFRKAAEISKQFKRFDI